MRITNVIRKLSGRVCEDAFCSGGAERVPTSSWPHDQAGEGYRVGGKSNRSSEATETDNLQAVPRSLLEAV